MRGVAESFNGSLYGLHGEHRALAENQSCAAAFSTFSPFGTKESFNGSLMENQGVGRIGDEKAINGQLTVRSRRMLRGVAESFNGSLYGF